MIPVSWRMMDASKDSPISRGEVGLAPAVLVEVGDEGVELVHELGVDKMRFRRPCRPPDRKLVVRVDAGVDEILGHRAGLAAERAGRGCGTETFMARYAAPETPANRHPSPGVLQLGDDVADDGEEVILNETTCAIGRSTRAAEAPAHGGDAG